MIGIVRIAVLASDSYGANLNRRIDCLHLGVVLLEALRIGVRIMRYGVCVGLPGAVALVADFPVLEAVMLGDIGFLDPRGRLGWCARTVVDCDEGLGADRGGDLR